MSVFTLSISSVCLYSRSTPKGSQGPLRGAAGGGRAGGRSDRRIHGRERGFGQLRHGRVLPGECSVLAVAQRGRQPSRQESDEGSHTENDAQTTALCQG